MTPAPSRAGPRQSAHELPVMPPVAPMLAKSVADHPARRLLRAEVGRLPVADLPRRRRGRVRQPQRAADDPLLPRAGRGGQGRTARAVRARRRDRHRHRRRAGLRGAAAAHPPGRVAGDDAVASRRRRRSSPSTCSPSATTTTPAGRSPSVGPRSSARWPTAKAPIHLTPTTTDREVAERWFVELEGAGPGRRDRQAARRHLPAGQARHVQDQARPRRPTACSPASAGTRRSTEAARSSARCCSGCYNDERQAAARRRGRRVHREAPRRTGRRARAAAARATATTTRGRSGPTPRRTRVSGCPATSAAGTRPRTCRSCRCVPSGCSRSSTSTWRAPGSGTWPTSCRWRDDRTPESCTYEQLEQPLTYALDDIVPGLAELDALRDTADTLPATAHSDVSKRGVRAGIRLARRR